MKIHAAVSRRCHVHFPILQAARSSEEISATIFIVAHYWSSLQKTKVHVHSHITYIYLLARVFRRACIKTRSAVSLQLGFRVGNVQPSFIYKSTTLDLHYMLAAAGKYVTYHHLSALNAKVKMRECC